MIIPNWPAPVGIKAYTTTVAEGNLATHTDLCQQEALKNRQRLQQTLNLNVNIQWLNQTHSTRCLELPNEDHNGVADACFTRASNTVCAVLTADCLPLLICHKKNSVIAAIHAGWKGLLNGIIEQTITALATKHSDLLVWLGPAIGPDAFALNADIRQQYLNTNPNYQYGFTQSNTGTWFANIYQLARIALNQLGINQIFGGHYCTYTHQRLYSYRRQKQQSGRMASLIWHQI